MNKENTDKLLNIIDLLDKIAKSNEREYNKQDDNKVADFGSSGLLHTLESLKKQKSVFPLNFQKVKSSSNSANKFLKDIKSKKTFFYLNKLTATEDSFSIFDKNNSLKKELSLYSSSDEYSKFYEIVGMKPEKNSDESPQSEKKNESGEGDVDVDIEKLERDGEGEEEKTEREDMDEIDEIKNQFMSNKMSDNEISCIGDAAAPIKRLTKKTIHFEEEGYKSDHIDKFTSIFSKKVMSKKIISRRSIAKETSTNKKSISKILQSKTNNTEESEVLCSIKMKSDFALLQRKKSLLHILKRYYSDSHLLTYTKLDSRDKMLFHIWRKQLRRSSKKKQAQKKTSSKKYRRPQRLKSAIPKKLDEEEYLDHTIIGHLFERIIETLNVNLKGNIRSFMKRINKLKQDNENLKNKLETAVENNDDQAQEIRDLNKRIKEIEEQKMDFHKIIEKYEREIDESKQLESKMQSNVRHINSLEQENKNLKKEINHANNAFENLKNEAIELQEKIDIKNQLIKKETEKLRLANAQIHQKNMLISQLQLLSKIDADGQKESTLRKVNYSTRRRQKASTRYYSDTILNKYERIRLKLFDSNERGYFLSKKNLYLFKVLKSKIKKIKALKQEVTLHKEAMSKMKTKFDNIMTSVSRVTLSTEDIFNQLLAYAQHTENQKQLKIEELLRGNANLEKALQMSQVNLKQQNKFPSSSSSSSSSSKSNDENYRFEIEKLNELLDKKTNEYDLLITKYENIYKKYLKLLKKRTPKNADFTFIKRLTEEEEEDEPSIIHSFYVQNKKNTVLSKKVNENKLITYIRALVVHKNTDTKKLKNFKEESIYRDLECYISNEFLNKLEAKDILNIRYLYSFGHAKEETQRTCRNDFLKYITCK